MTVVDNVSFEVKQGQIFGLLGPNGAGKTTTVEMIEGLRRPDAGTIQVCGLDATRELGKVKEIIGVQLQATSLYDNITVKEALDLFGSYYKRSIPSPQLLDRVSLVDKGDSFIRTLSGGQKQRLALALALVNDPAVLFLDEPTTGLDPQARQNAWTIIRDLMEQGKTVMLTTHYMEEAESLCHQVGIMDRGRLIALDSPQGLIAGANLESTVEFTAPGNKVQAILERMANVDRVSREGSTYVLHTRQGSGVLRDLTRLADEEGITLENLSTRKGTLEDVFLALTGRRLRE